MTNEPLITQPREFLQFILETKLSNTLPCKYVGYTESGEIFLFLSDLTAEMLTAVHELEKKGMKIFVLTPSPIPYRDYITKPQEDPRSEISKTRRDGGSYSEATIRTKRSLVRSAIRENEGGMEKTNPNQYKSNLNMIKNWSWTLEVNDKGEVKDQTPETAPEVTATESEQLLEDGRTCLTTVLPSGDEIKTYGRYDERGNFIQDKEVGGGS